MTPTSMNNLASRALLLLTILALPNTTRGATNEQLLEEAVQQYRAALDSTDRDDRIQKFRRSELLFTPWSKATPHRAQPEFTTSIST